MNRLGLLILMLLLSASSLCIRVPEGHTSDEDECGLVSQNCIPDVLMPENFTTEDYVNTTNPYSDICAPEGALGEVSEAEGAHPLYVLVFADEEERATTRAIRKRNSGTVHYNWTEWATLQLERGDEALVAHFGIDIRILGFLDSWNSPNYLNTFDYLWMNATWCLKHFLGVWCSIGNWSERVDAIICITGQATPNDATFHYGTIGPGSGRDNGVNVVLLRWTSYWADDNVVQHEICHFYYAGDHECPPCCAMSPKSDDHYRIYVLEDDLFWWIFGDVMCALERYDWCSPGCHEGLLSFRGRFPLWKLNVNATVGGNLTAWQAAGPTVWIGVPPRTYHLGNDTSVSVQASPNTGYYLDHWILDGIQYTQNPITVTIDAQDLRNRTLRAYFAQRNITINVPQAPLYQPGAQGVAVWIDGSPFTVFGDRPVSLTVEAGSHTVQAQYSFAKEEEVPGRYYTYTFDHWSQDGSTNNPRTITVNSAMTFTAEYWRDPYSGIESVTPEYW